MAHLRFSPGTSLGRYTITELIAAGGMGEVYRAVDNKLDRTVAIKAISSAFLTDPSARPRFTRERDIAISLEHPHICRLLDAGHDAGVDYVVLEYLEGETLAARLRRGALPAAQALGYAIEISDALAYAHRCGIIHRDLKPQNVLLTSTGVKVLDFGLATLRRSELGSPPQIRTDTTVVQGNGPAGIMGTTPYLAPERLEGREADERTDVFGFGVVLYEMLTARRPFRGDSPAALIAATLAGEPDPMMLPHRHAAALEWVVRRCLAREPDERWQSFADVRAILKRLASRVADVRTAESATLWRSARPALFAALIVLAASAWLITTRQRPGNLDRVAPPSIAFSIPPPPGATFSPTDGSVQTSQLAVSPAGDSVAFVAAGGDGVSYVWIRPLDSGTPRRVDNTENAMYPFWAPDGRSIGFFAQGLMKRVDVDGGPAHVMAAAPNGRGASWSRDGSILFAPDTTGELQRISADGGTLTMQTRLDQTRGESSHRWPVFLPDARRFLYFASSEMEGQAGIYLASLDGAPAAFLARSNVGGAYVEPGWLLYVADGTLMARAIDVEGRRLHGDPVIIADGVSGSSTFYPAVAAGSGAVIAYASDADAAEVAWVDSEGRRVGTALPPGRYVDFHLSRDGKSLAFAEVDARTGRSDLWALELTLARRLRLTSARATDASAVWSPDGSRVAFRSNRDGVHDLYMRTLDSAGADRAFLLTEAAKYPTSWSRDGQFLIYHVMNPTGDIWAAPVERPADAFALVNGPFHETQGEVSPDGQWLAYTTDESEVPQVYVQAFSRERRLPVSSGGGSDPRWSADGSTLYYLSADAHVMAVPMVRGGSLRPGTPVPLFRLSERAAPPYTSYDAAPDGRFLVRVPLENLRTHPLSVIVGWSPTR